MTYTKGAKEVIKDGENNTDKMFMDPDDKLAAIMSHYLSLLVKHMSSIDSHLANIDNKFNINREFKNLKAYCNKKVNEANYRADKLERWLDDK